jgi:hypothetical protein
MIFIAVLHLCKMIHPILGQEIVSCNFLLLHIMKLLQCHAANNFVLFVIMSKTKKCDQKFNLLHPSSKTYPWSRDNKNLEIMFLKK